MFVAGFAILVLGTALLAGLLRPPASASLRASEESAHSAAAARRAQGADRSGPERRRERPRALASVLGEPDGSEPCRILGSSRSALRIASGRKYLTGSQVHVRWGDDFFVGTVRNTLARNREYVAELDLLSSNRRWGLRWWLPSVRRPLNAGL